MGWDGLALGSLQAGSHLRAQARAAKSASDAGARVSGEAATITRAAQPREGEPALISANFSLPPTNRRNEIIPLNVGGNMKSDSNVDSSLTVANLGAVKWS